MGAPLAPVPGVIKIVLNGVSGGRPWANILHWEYSGTAGSNASALALATGVANAWQTNMAPECISTLTLNNVVATDLSATTAPNQQYIPTTPIPGSRGDDPIPGNAAMLVSYPINVRYKGGHPRTYLYVLGFSDVTDPVHWNPNATTEVQNHWRAFLAAVGALQYGGVGLGSFCAVRYHGKYLPNSGGDHFYLTTPVVISINAQLAETSQQMASQKRRIGRVHK
jgi:hypothetical protein